MSVEMRKEEKSTSDDPDAESLVLYHSLGSSYSQRVLMALHEKKLTFDSCLIDLYSGEHLEPFFINLNPKAEVPVLVDGKKTVAESSQILEYLDENYSEGDSPRLILKGGVEGDKLKKMRKIIEQIPVPIVTFGAIYHPQLSVNPQMTETEKQLRLNALKTRLTLLDSFIVKHPEFEAKYQEKKEKFRKFFSTIQDINSVKDALKKLERTLDIIEEELSRNEDGWWLCGPNFTVVDIFLAVVLHRINHVGLMTLFFQDGVRPNIMKYYERVQQRDSFIETFKIDFVDDDIPGSIFSYTTLFVTLGLIVFAIVSACAHLKNH